MDPRALYQLIVLGEAKLFFEPEPESIAKVRRIFFTVTFETYALDRRVIEVRIFQLQIKVETRDLFRDVDRKFSRTIRSVRKFEGQRDDISSGLSRKIGGQLQINGEMRTVEPEIPAFFGRNLNFVSGF